MTLELETLLPWSAPATVETKAGTRLLRKAKPTESFWSMWKSNKETLKAAGISCSQYNGNWEAVWWQPIDPIKAQQQREAKELEQKEKQAALAGQLATLTPEQEARLSQIADKLIPYQIPSVRRQVNALTNYGGALDASDTGVGKTYVNLAACYVLGLKPFIVCPKAVKPSWKRAAQHFGMQLIGVSNYERVREGEVGVTKCEFEYVKTFKAGKLVEKRELKSMEWLLSKETVIIGDEIHRMKDYKTLNCQLGLRAMAQGYKVLGLSATAADNPMQMKFSGLLTGLFKTEKQFWPWMMRNGVEKARFGLEFRGGRRVLDQIHQQIFPLRGTRIKIADLGDQFPETQITAEAYAVNGAAEEINRIYSEMEAELCRLSEKSKEDKECVLTIRLRARQKTELLKVPAIVELVESAVEEGLSVAVFINFDESADALMAKLKTKCCIRGSQQGPKGEIERQRCIDDFNADKEHIIVCNIKAGGVGVNLHGTPSSRMRMSIICVTDSAQDAKQALGRVWRAKGAKSIQKFFFAAETIEETDILPNMRAKIDRIDTLNDGDLRLRSEYFLPMDDEQLPTVESVEVELPKAESPRVERVNVTLPKEDPNLPKISREQIELALEGLRRLADRDHDHASERNGVGFSGTDTGIGHSLAGQSSLSQRQANIAVKLCRKYVRQLGREFVERLS